MFGLDYTQQEAIGLSFLWNKLIPNSPYGVEQIKQIKPFGRSGQAALAECFDHIETVIRLAKEHKAELDTLCLHLMSLKNIRGCVNKCNNHTLHQVELFEVKQFLLVFEKLCITYKALEQRFQLNGIDLLAMDGALDILDPEQKRIAAFTVDSPELAVIRREKLHVEALLQKETGESAKNVLTTKRFQLVKREEQEETRVMRELSEALRVHLPAFHFNMDNIGKLDLIIAKAMLALEYGGIRPQISDRGIVSFQNMSNPFVADALAKKGQTLTQVSLTLSEGVTIITGANMGGKSVSVKTAVLNVTLCQMGFFVFAEQAEIPLFDGICLISEDMQDIGRGLSSFGAEIVRFNEVVTRLKTEFLFVALDEFARGTNPAEGAALVRGVASYLSESGSVCVMTTHYDGVVLPTFKHYQVAGLSFPETEQESMGNLAFIADYMDYNLIEAGTETAPPRDALTICKIIGLDQGVLERIGSEYPDISD